MLVDNRPRAPSQSKRKHHACRPRKVLFLVLALFVADVDGKQVISKNNVTDFFNKEIENRQGLDSVLDSSKSRAQDGIKGNQGASELGVSNADMERKTSELNAIGANDLEAAGMQERAKPENSYYNGLELNYDDPQVINHHRDIDKIVKGTEDMVKNLLEGLKDYNVDCKTVRGDKEIEPQYFIDVQKKPQEDTVYNSFTDIQQRQQKDTNYNKQICEQLRNKYRCSYIIALRCVKNVGGNVNEVRLPIEYAQLPRHWWKLITDNTNPDPRNLEYSHTTYPVINESDASVHREIRQHVARVLQVHIDYIVSVRIDRQLDYLFPHKRLKKVLMDKNFIVSYGDGPKRCLQWSEDWNESCMLN